MRHRSVLQHHLHPQHVVGGGAVGQAVRPAGVLGDVAPQAARPLARRVRRVAHPVPAHVSIQVQVDNPRLHHGVAVLPVHFQDAVHPREGNLYPVGMRNRPAAQSRAGATPHHRDAGLVAERHHLADLVGVQRKHHRTGHSPVYGAVILEDQQVVGVKHHVVITHDSLEPDDEFSYPEGCQSAARGGSTDDVGSSQNAPA